MTSATTHRLTAESAETTPIEMRRIFDAQREAQRRDGTPSASERRDRIDRFLLALLESAEEIVQALEADFGGRPELFSYRAEFLGMLPAIEHARDHLESWMAPETIAGSADLGIPTFLQKKPKGVVGVIGPWNFPVQLTAQPAIEALAAGNRVMIKFSEIPQRTAEVFARAVASRMDPEEVAVVIGGPATAAAFSDLPFDHLFFTGSPGIGRRVAAAAGKNLVPVTLELGGKNPVVISRSADIDTAAERIMGNRMFNGGQLCLCPDDVFVAAEQVEEFVDAYRAHLTATFPDYANSPDVVTSVNPANYRRVRELIEDARAKGARVVGAVPDDAVADPRDESARRITPTILLGVTDEMTVASEEIFGPVIAVHPYDEVDEAIDTISRRPHPLAAYWYGDDDDDYQRFLERTTSGGVTRNDGALHLALPDVPFGGVGQSGTGYYHGKAGFDTFTHVRAVAASELPSRMSGAGTPPYRGSDLDAARHTITGMIDTLRSRAG
jgi:coniferyl-aldehyde dehydrogenase